MAAKGELLSGLAWNGGDCWFWHMPKGNQNRKKTRCWLNVLFTPPVFFFCLNPIRQQVGLNQLLMLYFWVVDWTIWSNSTVLIDNFTKITICYFRLIAQLFHQQVGSFQSQNMGLSKDIWTFSINKNCWTINFGFQVAREHSRTSLVSIKPCEHGSPTSIQQSQF